MAKKNFKVIGLMSGTSMDGIDATIIVTDGFKVLETGSGIFYPYKEEFKEKIRNLIKGQGDPDQVAHELTLLHVWAVEKLLQEADETKESIDLIGFHGHTTDHRPHEGITVQIGDGKLLSRMTSIDVVNDFRVNDVKAGGQGAPLVPIYHQALLESEEKPVAVVNIGGVANITWIGKHDGDLLAFDTGPGNALLDDWIRGKTGKAYDENGDISSAGKVNPSLLNEFMQNPYFAIKPPKSIDRNHFSKILDSYNISIEDGAATLAAFTAESIAISEEFFSQPVKRWLIAGGGRHNMAIMKHLKERLKAPVINIDELGFSGDMLEAQAFAFLAARNILGLPISFPGTTGVPQPMCGGVLTKAR